MQPSLTGFFYGPKLFVLVELFEFFVSLLDWRLIFRNANDPLEHRVGFTAE